MKKAFTLAEVLITLTIIGVIAALTIPNLTQSYKKHQVEASLKEAYSILSNAIKMSVAENGPVDSWRADSTCNFAETYIFPYLKLQYECGGAINMAGSKYLRDGCFVDNNNGGSWYWLNGTLSTGENGYGAERFCKAKLQNGMDFGVWWSPNYSDGKHLDSYPSLYKFVFDINGSQGSTTAGKDVFFFYINPNNPNPVLNTLSTSGYVYTSCNNSSFTASTGSHAGAACSRLIQNNSWKIPDDYPVKKF